MAHHKPVHCSGRWNTGSSSCSDKTGAAASVFMFMASGKVRRAEIDGKRFADHDAASDAIAAAGYSTVYYSRPACFIDLRLPKRCRQYLATLPSEARVPAVWRILNGLNKRAANWYKDSFDRSFENESVAKDFAKWRKQAIA